MTFKTREIIIDWARERERKWVQEGWLGGRKETKKLKRTDDFTWYFGGWEEAAGEREK